METKTDYKPKLLLRHFTDTTSKGEDVALFVPAKTKRGINCYRALILADCNFVAGERLSLFPHKGMNPKIKERLAELKKQTDAILKERQLRQRASFTTMEQVARMLADIERREKGLPPEPIKRPVFVESYSNDSEQSQDDEPEEWEDEGDNYGE